MKNRYVRKSLAAAVLASMASMAVAEVSIEEVVVTARKRAENLQEVPIAVTAFTESQIESAGIQQKYRSVVLSGPGPACTLQAGRSGYA